jgi:hypothetical protein
MKPILIVIIFTLLSGCYHAPDVLKPMPWIFNMMPKDAPNTYKRGWKDGCESGMANMTNSFYRKFYTFRQEKSLRDDATYYKAWKDTYNFCRHYAYGTLRESDQRTRLPNAQTSFQNRYMGAEGILEKGLLHMWGPVDWLVPMGKVGHIGGDRFVGTGQTEREVIGGVSTLDYSGETMIGNDDGGWTLDYSNVPFFGATDAPGY